MQATPSAKRTDQHCSPSTLIRGCNDNLCKLQRQPWITLIILLRSKRRCVSRILIHHNWPSSRRNSNPLRIRQRATFRLRAYCWPRGYVQHDCIRRGLSVLDCEFNLSVGQNTVTVPLASSKAKRFFDAKVATRLIDRLSPRSFFALRRENFDLSLLSLKAVEPS